MRHASVVSLVAAITVSAFAIGCARDSARAAFPGGELVDLSHSYGADTVFWPTAGLHPDAARWLIENREFRAIGIDTASIDFGQRPGVREPGGAGSPSGAGRLRHRAADEDCRGVGGAASRYCRAAALTGQSLSGPTRVIIGVSPHPEMGL